MALMPMIVIGCGGSGGKTIQLLRRSLEIRLRRAGWESGIPEAWQLLYVDTPVSQEADPRYGGPIPDSDYISVTGRLTSYRDADHALIEHARRGDNLAELIGWRPEPNLPVPLLEGAGQMRAVGRVAAFSALSRLGPRLVQATKDVRQGLTELSQLSPLLGADGFASDSQVPYVIVVSSLAGGTGAGIVLDVCDVLRAANPELHNRIMGVLYTAEVFSKVQAATGLQPNSLAAISELMCSYLDPERPASRLYQGVVHMPTGSTSQSGINYPYVVGTTTLGGATLSSVDDCYRSVAETLTAAISNPAVNADLLQFQITNWENEQGNNSTAWSFGNTIRDSGAKGLSGVVSSFGSARLSLGMNWFTEYSVHRLARSIVEFQVGHFEEIGRQLMEDRNSSRVQIVKFLVEREGLGFIERCQLREFNDVGHESNQVLDQILSDEEIISAWTGWRGTCVSELSTAERAGVGVWAARIRGVIIKREGAFYSEVNRRIDEGGQRFAERAVGRLLTEVSQTLAEHGLPVALGLLNFTRNSLEQAATQLKNEATDARQQSAIWEQQLASVFVGVKDQISANHRMIEEGVRQGGAKVYREAQARAKERAAALVAEFASQVLRQLELTLDQMSAEIGSEESIESVRSWPDDLGVPDGFSPPPFEYCLVDPGTWPALFQQRLAATISGDANMSSPMEAARREVGGGGFSYESSGRTVTAPTALVYTDGQRWSPRVAGGTGLPMQFAHHFSVSEIVERSRLWLGRPGTAFGRILGQELGQYLSGLEAGEPVPDAHDRLKKFQKSLASALASAKPLISIDTTIAQRVHPLRTQFDTSQLVAERLPFPVGHPARAVAEDTLRVFAAKGTNGEPEFGELFSDGSRDVEGVTYLSRLTGAVHPAIVSSLITPIQSQWLHSRGNIQARAGFWSYRRARPLRQFIPVEPKVLRSMIRGYLSGRMLGLIPDPTPEDGFSIARAQTSQARFPWPLLCGEGIASGSKRVSWLPMILESLPLAFAMFAMEQNSVDAYEELFLLGQSNRRQPGPHYESISQELERWISEGAVIGGQVAPQVTGATATERRENLIIVINEYVTTLDKKVTRYPLKSASPDFVNNEFFTLPEGFDLFPHMKAVYEDLAKSVARFDVDEAERG
jgi:hypothetical protein